MLTRHVSILGLALLTSMLLFQFQNCAPAPQAALEKGGSDPQVRIVDDWSKTEIQFVSDAVQVHDETVSVGVGGLCNRNRNGAGLTWILQADDGSRPLLVGEGVCHSGQFEVQLDNLDPVVCGIPHRLVVQGDWGGVAVSQFEKRCQPVASEEVAPPTSSPLGTQCTLEYAPADATGNSCSEVCYRENKVVLSIAAEPARCAGLMQKLASP